MDEVFNLLKQKKKNDYGIGTDPPPPPVAKVN